MSLYLRFGNNSRKVIAVPVLVVCQGVKQKQRMKQMIYLNFMNQPFRFNAFGFSSAFLLWAVLGLVDGFIIPLFFGSENTFYWFPNGK